MGRAVLEYIGLAALIAAYLSSVVFPLVVLPWILERHGDLPYNSVASRLVAWGSFTALIFAVSALLANGLRWDPLGWAIGLAVIAFAAWWDIRDLKLRRIPQGRHPDA